MLFRSHLAAWKLDRSSFGFADRNRAELQELAPQPELKKHKVEVSTVRTTRSQAAKEAEQPEEQRKREEEAVAETWRKISEEHRKEKEAEERRKIREQAKG